MSDETSDTAEDEADGVPEWLIRVGRISWLAIGVGIAATAMVAAVMAFAELVIPVVLAAFPRRRVHPAGRSSRGPPGAEALGCRVGDRAHRGGLRRCDRRRRSRAHLPGR